MNSMCPKDCIGCVLARDRDAESNEPFINHCDDCKAGKKPAPRFVQRVQVSYDGVTWAFLDEMLGNSGLLCWQFARVVKEEVK